MESLDTIKFLENQEGIRFFFQFFYLIFVLLFISPYSPGWHPRFCVGITHTYRLGRNKVQTLEKIKG